MPSQGSSRDGPGKGKAGKPSAPAPGRAMLAQPDRRGTERVEIHIPIRVLGIGPDGKEFCQDTYTEVVNRTGARIALKHPLSPGEPIRVINLQNSQEADFRVVGPTHLTGKDPPEWGIECLEPHRSLWGIEFAIPAASTESEQGTLLECRTCGNQLMWLVSPMEAEVLDSTGAITVDCPRCGRLTYWTYAGAKRLPMELFPPEPLSQHKPKKAAHHPERRNRKRAPLRMRILVRSIRGEEEVSQTQNVSRAGFAVSLAMKLSVGELVTIVCPYTEGGPVVQQRARVKWRYPHPSGPTRLYGLSYES